MDNRIALDPQNSIVVEACAGSGKTWLLVSRIVRLLLAGTEPGEILAITFTRKAAQEMQQRLHQWLHYLATATEDELTQFLRERAVDTVDDVMMRRARNLYRKLLLSPTAITINTFHGWFMQIIQRAPLNAGVPVGLRLQERTSALREEAWSLLGEQLRADPEGALADRMHYLFAEIGLHNTRQLLDSFLDKRAEWWTYTEGAGEPVAMALQQLQEMLEIDADAEPLSALHETAFDLDLQSYASLLDSGTAKQREIASELEQARQETVLALRFSALWAAFFTQKGEPRKLKSIKGQDEALHDRLLHALQMSLQHIQDDLVEQQALHLNHAGLMCGVAYLEQYQSLKLRQQLMDFTDVEYQVARLMQQGDSAAYMQYKLDSRYRQVLLDEFQDTNPLQWQILHAWFDASVAAGEPPRIFVVGDPKQSIYRFRRADARLFGEARHFLQQAFGAHYLAQNETRRNAPAVLDTVNQVFSSHPDGFNAFEQHTAHARDIPGYVHVLPLHFNPQADTEAVTEAAGLSLRNPLNEPRSAAEGKAREDEAATFAETVEQIVGNWAVSAADGVWRRAGYGDIMVLVRKRTHLRVYESALRNRNIPYITSRRGGLLDTLEAEDIQSLLTFLITPFADLALAQVLRCPIFSCSDEELMGLAQDGGEGGWWGKLQRCTVSGGMLGRARALLRDWQHKAESLPVHDLLDYIYFTGDVLHRYAAAVPESMRENVQANLQALLEVALDVDGGRYPSLPKFLAELRELRKAEKESPDEGVVGEAGNAVRIYTVHESKGLEAPIVWLLDANDTRAKHDGYGVLVDWPVQAGKPLHFSLYGDAASRGKKRRPLFDAEEMQEKRENMNLLYVAMTRAKQALVVSGNGRSEALEKRKGALSWFDRIAGTVVAANNPLYREAGGKPEVAGLQTAVIDPLLNSMLPTGQREAFETREQQRGTWLHALLQHMGGREPQADREMLRARYAIPEAELEKLWQEAGLILGQPHLQRFFDPAVYLDAQNELPYVNAQGEQKRIDRLVEFADEVWVLDYKTGKQSGAEKYRKQMEEYRQAIQHIFADRQIRCALIFADGKMQEI